MHLAKNAAAYALPNEEPDSIKIEQPDGDDGSLNADDIEYEQLALSFDSVDEEE